MYLTNALLSSSRPLVTHIQPLDHQNSQGEHWLFSVTWPRGGGPWIAAEEASVDHFQAFSTLTYFKASDFEVMPMAFIWWLWPQSWESRAEERNWYVCNLKVWVCVSNTMPVGSDAYISSSRISKMSFIQTKTTFGLWENWESWKMLSLEYI